MSGASQRHGGGRKVSLSQMGNKRKKKNALTRQISFYPPVTRTKAEPASSKMHESRQQNQSTPTQTEPIQTTTPPHATNQHHSYTRPTAPSSASVKHCPEHKQRRKQPLTTLAHPEKKSNPPRKRKTPFPPPPFDAAIHTQQTPPHKRFFVG